MDEEVCREESDLWEAPPQLATESEPPAQTEGPVGVFPDEDVEPEVSQARGELYADQYGCDPAPPMPTNETNPDVAKQHVEELSGMSDDDKRLKLAAMSDAEVKAMVESLPPEEMSRLADLSEFSSSPSAKYVMWRAGHRARVQEDVDAIDPDMDEAQAEELRARRQAIADGTSKEMDEEEKLLEKKLEDGTLSADEVNELVARKNKEHEIEMTYNVNLTATGETRTLAGPLKGTRVVWSSDELNAVGAALAQVPEREVEKMRTLNRSEQVINDGRNVRMENDFRGNINVGDLCAEFDAKGKLGEGKFGGARDPMANPEIAARYGAKTTYLEWTLVHEQGHTAHDVNDPAYQQYKAEMGIVDYDADQAKEILSADQLATIAGGTKVEIDGVVYAKDGDGVRSYPAGVDGWSTASNGEPSPKEYFSEHYNQAILAPEETAKEFLDVPQQKEQDAFFAQRRAEAEVKALQAAGAPVPRETQQKLDEANAALALASKERETWQATYDTMRNQIFGTADTEGDATMRMIEAGVDSDTMNEFYERAARLSTPDQIERLEQELMERKRK